MQERKPPGHVQLIKQMNREAILQQIREKGQLSRASLAELTALSKPSISTLVDELLQEGWIKEVGIGESSGGRRPIMLELNAQEFAIIGAVFEGTGLELAVTNLNGEILQERHVVIKPGDSSAVLDALEQELRLLIQQSGVAYERVLGIGIGLPGVTQKRSGTISFSPSTGWNGWPVREEMENRLSLPIFPDNDVNLMALGEFYKGAGQGAQHLVYIHVGTGIGAGIILNGQLFRGFSEASGEIGYQVVGRPQQQRQHGFGAFEGNYSSQALAQRVANHPNLQDKNLDFSANESVIKKLVDLSETNPIVKEILEEACTHWAYGIANVACLLNPELVVLGGDIAQIGDWGLAYIHQVLERTVPVMPNVKFAELGDRAGVIGAVFNVLEADRSLTGKLGGLS